ncbi:hypothetical protein SKAU_G00054940 [Synaphobranchus kaupii]|uniref:Uncharacterized protein n=1 Tax=Synaphobranchus kaupii TaxID=118154 RepID=A0A9Q1G3R0_SYNKA|nr:hypothetical protein SKAU_G00054940 [Synaphobranchus kaupii]
MRRKSRSRNLLFWKTLFRGEVFSCATRNKMRSRFAVSHWVTLPKLLFHPERCACRDASRARVHTTKVVFHNACCSICRRRGARCESPAGAEGPKPQLSLFAESQRLARNAI